MEGVREPEESVGKLWRSQRMPCCSRLWDFGFYYKSNGEPLKVSEEESKILWFMF